jgi:putative restriction endonuclease
MARYWWVNHTQTFRQEIEGGYLWSPKRERNGARSQFYENMRLASPGDFVLSFAKTKISFIGRVADFALSAPKPSEFGSVGSYWATEGWLLPIIWSELTPPARPKARIAELAPLLPPKYSPINAATGDGTQKVYLAEISRTVFELITGGAVNNAPSPHGSTERPFQELVAQLESAVEKQIETDRSVSETEKMQLMKARRGQGQFRERLCKIEGGCRITGVSNPALLVASHIKPWRACGSANERLDGHNGLLLTPHVDLLFDRGFISFQDDGKILLSTRIDMDDLRKLGLEERFQRNVGSFLDEQRRYLSYHRETVFLG